MAILKASPYFKNDVTMLGYVFDLEKGTLAEVVQKWCAWGNWSTMGGEGGGGGDHYQSWAQIRSTIIAMNIYTSYDR